VTDGARETLTRWVLSAKSSRASAQRSPIVADRQPDTVRGDDWWVLVLLRAFQRSQDRNTPGTAPS
jgi:hypothetical protein